MDITELLLLLAVTANSRSKTTECALCAILDALTEILKLALGFLLLASLVLLDTSAAEALNTGDVSGGFLDGADGLVPGAGGAVRVVVGDSAGVGVGGDGAELGGCVGSFTLGLGLFLGDFTLGLGGC